ncbi:MULTISPECIES: alpha/beta hydrolase [Colwellia]|jgi:pimeloyl-ACP methyl ester carboxylesterase|uniref:Hydrolase, alpha/beta hydrolase fold family n=1 Tax=Colwellia psychrerythraea (strain 34H / ATCC BAA-681) TaxID=167879 RepID=Q488P2_COLP3|nr:MULTISPECIES: alpha/beta hydrolase [Colwellia]AAZ27593.1 hydrolase, alpha/beta hydrolase fold family [Colwellia psychrerythraea 34H]PKH86356.1 alpha/beta hydrolase [Colwellia sp. Bg11-28]
MKVTWKNLLALSLLSLTATSWANDSKLTLENCHLGEIRSQVQCGKLEVPENYQQPDGDKIAVNFAVLPAIDDSEYKAPLMFLAGGPGQAAVELATGLNRVFREVRKTRDIILVDQRGTGKSSPLSCEFEAVDNVYSALPDALTPQEVKDCVAQFKGDVTQYNSENAIRDFDAIRAALGHEKLNIYGGSYGTRAGLVFMRMFPESLESVVLDSVGPIEVPIGMFGQSGARSFNLLIDNCKNSESCHKAFPNLADEFQAVKVRLAKEPASIDILHPRLGTPTKLVIDETKFTGNLRFQLYGMEGRSMVPLVIHQAFLGNYQPLVGLMARTEGEQLVYTGLLFNIVCNEDMPRLSVADKAADANNNFDGKDSQLAWDMVCPFFPKYRPSEGFYQSVTADIPTLILSGNLDPVTPPSNGEYSAKTLPNSHHIIVENASHTVAMSTCASDIIQEFLTSKTPKKLDESCLKDIPQETFMTSVNGIQ